MDQLEKVTGSSKEISDAARNAANRGKDAMTDAAEGARERSSVDIAALRDEVNNLKETVMKAVASATTDVASSARDATSNLAGRVNSAAGELAERGRDAVSAGTDQAKNILDEFEGMARRNPVGTLAAAVVLGIVIGMMGRRN